MAPELPQAVRIEPVLSQILRHFENTQLCIACAHRDEGSSSDDARGFDAFQKALKSSRLAFVRIVGVGRLNEADQASKPVEIKAVVVFNARKGNGCALPAFGERMGELARENGMSNLLHRLGGGPVTLIDIMTGKFFKVYQSLEEAVPDFFGLVGGDRFQLESLERVLSRAKGSRWMAAMGAQAVGEMLSVADYTPGQVD